MPDPEKRFTLTFSMEGEAFQGSHVANQIMRILDLVRGDIATGRFNRPVLDAAGLPIGECRIVWRADPPSAPAEPVSPRRRR